MPHHQIPSSSCNHPGSPGTPGTTRSFGRGYRRLLVLCLLVLVAINGLSSSSDPSLTSVPPSSASSLSQAEVALPAGPSAPTSVVPFASFFSLRTSPLASTSFLPFPAHPLDLPDFTHTSEVAAPTTPLSAKSEQSLRLQSTRRMLVTAYCPGKCCCGKDDGITASGRHVRDFDHHLVAAPPDIPFRTLVSVPGYIDEQPVPVLDRGGMIQGDRLDVCFPTHAQAKAWGSQWLDVSFWSHQEKSE